ncbi:diguanylate cyclase [Thalassotalea sp. LPB0316]|uniref:sensor domain-containing diguanylate cyclase n=1 Tax=Thalassotalea sp. LPB0316 TaxID=2769490 RepID=UPI0018695416|nr:diguanylate cyclase [Thalassotalea sp. LPB0316]QOL25632.1 diguanylate cyclase [Thalassotalea sp. LPB0316]
MKALTFNQIQIRIFILIFVLFTCAVISYRAFVERPKLELRISELVRKELQVLNQVALTYMSSIESINYDYAVWDRTYSFVENRSNDYIEENFVEDTFVSLQLDGIFIFAEDLTLAFSRGFDHRNHKALAFDVFDFKRFPEHTKIFPSRLGSSKVAKASGMINTKHGPALFSVTEIKKTDRTGDERGFVLFLQLFSEEVVDDIEKFTMTEVTVSPVSQTQAVKNLANWTDEVEEVEISPNTQLYIRDFLERPILLLVMEHSNGEFPPLLDKQSTLFISIFTILIFIVYSMISNIIIQPMKQLASQIKNIEDTHSDKLIDENFHIDELDSVSRHFNKLMSTISQQNAMLSQQALTDALTHIANRRSFELALERQSQLFIRQGLSFTVIIADIDHFKKYNDELGHLAGDEALIKVAQTLSQHFKRTNDLCARYGGEEFIMLYSDISVDDLRLKLDEIVSSFAKLNISHPNSPTASYITVSLGACIVEASDSPEQILRPKSITLAADNALYEAKKSGRNQWKYISYQDFVRDNADL